MDSRECGLAMRCVKPYGHQDSHSWVHELKGSVGLDGDTKRDWATDGPALERRIKELEALLAAQGAEQCSKCGGQIDVNGHCVFCRAHAAPPVQGAGTPPQGENWWSGAALDVIRSARMHEPHDDWQDWQNAIVNGLLSAYNRGQDAAHQSPVEALQAKVLEEAAQVAERFHFPAALGGTSLEIAAAIRALAAQEKPAQPSEGGEK